MNIHEAIELAKKSEYGLCWFSEKGRIYITKEGVIGPLGRKLPELPDKEDHAPPTPSVRL